jgi:hypothetical protein
MEALDSLSMENTLRTEVCEHMLQALNKAPPEFLPAIVSFLISSDDPIENLVQVGYKFGSFICLCDTHKIYRYDIKCLFVCLFMFVFCTSVL